MKTKVVLWGENAKNEKVLVALELRTDVINRAQTEWHFMVLSNKLSKAYANELEDLKELVGKADNFQQDTWDRLKEFWGKVQGQVQERNLFRGHADELRDETNKLFEAMKGMRKKLDEEFRGKSTEAMGTFMGMIDKVEAKAKEGGRLRPLFDELVEVQRKYRESKNMTRDHRNKVWAKLDGAFKEVKGKLFGDQGDRNKNQGNSPSARTQRRLDGLLNAIEKMERSMHRDQDDLEFQNRRIKNSDGQLETQIRQAKLKMIEERFNSKGEKLKDMHKTKAELEERIVKEKALIDNAVDVAAAGIPAEEAATKTAAVEEESTGILEEVGTMISEAAEDAVDTAKAIASVVSSKVSEAVEELRSYDGEEEEEE